MSNQRKSPAKPHSRPAGARESDLAATRAIPTRRGPQDGRPVHKGTPPRNRGTSRGGGGGSGQTAGGNRGRQAPSRAGSNPQRSTPTQAPARSGQGAANPRRSPSRGAGAPQDLSDRRQPMAPQREPNPLDELSADQTVLSPRGPRGAALADRVQAASASSPSQRGTAQNSGRWAMHPPRARGGFAPAPTPDDVDEAEKTQLQPTRPAAGRTPSAAPQRAGSVSASSAAGRAGAQASRGRNAGSNPAATARSGGGQAGTPGRKAGSNPAATARSNEGKAAAIPRSGGGQAGAPPRNASGNAAQFQRKAGGHAAQSQRNAGGHAAATARSGGANAGASSRNAGTNPAQSPRPGGGRRSAGGNPPAAGQGRGNRGRGAHREPPSNAGSGPSLTRDSTRSPNGPRRVKAGAISQPLPADDTLSPGMTLADFEGLEGAAGEIQGSVNPVMPGGEATRTGPYAIQDGAERTMLGVEAMAERDRALAEASVEKTRVRSGPTPVSGGTRGSTTNPREPAPTAKTSRAEALARLHEEALEEAAAQSNMPMGVQNSEGAHASEPWDQGGGDHAAPAWGDGGGMAFNAGPGGGAGHFEDPDGPAFEGSGGGFGNELGNDLGFAQPIWNDDDLPDENASWQQDDAEDKAQDERDDWQEPGPATRASKAIWFDTDQNFGPAVSIEVNPGLEGQGIAEDAPLRWAKEAWDAYGDHLFGLVALHAISLVLLACTGGLLLGPVMVGYLRYINYLRQGERASIMEATRLGDQFSDAFALGLYVWLLCFLGSGIGLAVAGILSFIPFIGWLLSWLVSIPAALIGLLLFPLGALAFSLLLLRDCNVGPQTYLNAVYKICRKNPRGALHFAALAGALIGLSGAFFGIGALIGGPVGIWMIAIAFDEIFEGDR